MAEREGFEPSKATKPIAIFSIKSISYVCSYTVFECDYGKKANNCFDEVLINRIRTNILNHVVSFLAITGTDRKVVIRYKATRLG